MTSTEDQWSEGQSAKRYPAAPRNYDAGPKGALNSRRRYDQDERRLSRVDSRLDTVQNGSYRRGRSTDDESSDRKSLQTRSRVTSSSDDHFERSTITPRRRDDDVPPRRASSVRREIALDNFERSSRRDSRTSSIGSDVQIGRKTPARDASSRRVQEAETLVKAEDDERVQRPVAKNLRSRESSRDRETIPKRDSSLRRETSVEDMERSSVRRKSSVDSDGQSVRKTVSRESFSRKSQEITDQVPSRSSSRNQGEIREARRSVERERQREEPPSGKIEDEPIKRLKRTTSLEKEAKEGATNVDQRILPEDSNETKTVMEIPNEEWACEHCTFINNLKDRVCVVCCKTRSSALPPTEEENVEDAPSVVSEAPKSESANASNNVSNVGTDLEKRTSLLKISNGEESGDSGPTKNKGRARRKISFSFGTKPNK